MDLNRAILGIEHAHAHGWSNLWLELDLKLVILAFRKPSVVPWKIRNKWDKCMHFQCNSNFLATYIYREIVLIRWLT